MMIDENKNGLKGQHNLAQGKRSGALGWKTDMKIVRAITFIKEKILLRTSEMTLCFPEMMSGNSLRGFHYMDLRFAPIRKLNSVRMKLFASFIESSRTVFLLHPLPRAAPGFTGIALGYDILAFQAGRKF
jgi:hypothetical protein